MMPSAFAVQRRGPLLFGIAVFLPLNEMAPVPRTPHCIYEVRDGWSRPIDGPMRRADWTGKDRLFAMPFSSAYQTQPHYAAVLAISAHKTSVINGRKLSFRVHLGSGNRVLPSAFSYRSSQAAFFCFCSGLGKYR